VIEAHISNLRRKLNRGEDGQWIGDAARARITG